MAGRSAQEHPESPLAVDGVDRTAERRGDVVRAGQHRFDVHEVADRCLGSDPSLVVGRERSHRRPTRPDAPRPHRAGRPGRHSPAHPTSAMHDRSTRRAGRCRRAEPTNRHRDPSERAGAHQRLEITDLAAVVLGDERRDEVRQRRGESRLGHVGEHRRPRPDRFGARRTRGRCGAPGDPTIASDEIGQFLDAGLEDHVTRQRLDHVAHRSPGVALDGRTRPGRPPRAARSPIAGMANTLWR